MKIDNFDPQQVGVPPRQFGISADDWSTAESTYPVVAARVNTKKIIIL